MNKYFILAIGSLSLMGCASLQQQRKLLKAQNEMNHKIYIAVENARLHNEPANILGGKIKSAIEEFEKNTK